MKTLESTAAVQYTINLPQDIGQHPNTSHFLANALQSLFVLLEQRGQPVTSLIDQDVTPELLESLLAQNATTSVELSPTQLADVERGLADLEAGRTVSEKEMDRFFDDWETRLSDAK